MLILTLTLFYLKFLSFFIKLNKIYKVKSVFMDKQFYKFLKEFLKDLNGVFPEDDEIKIITSTINICIIDDEEHKLIKKFYNALSPLEQMINIRDDNFFYLDHSIYWKKTSYQYQLFNKLNGYWDLLEINNKKIVWDYIQLLFKLSKDFNEIK